MLLKSLYDLAHSPTTHILSDIAFERRAIRWVINLKADGSFLGIQDTSLDGKRGKEFPAVPMTVRAKKGKVAEFLVDNIDAVFGLDPNPTKPKNSRMLKEKFDDFWGQIERAFKDTNQPGLGALVKFRATLGNVPTFLRAERNNWLLRLASDQEVRVGNSQFTFCVDGSLIIENEDVVKPYWRECVIKTIQDEETISDRGLCLITGEQNVPLARTHTPRIGNIPDVGIDGTIVSFEKSAPAFSSYGKIQSYNAPCSIAATQAYSRALLFLVNHPDHHFCIAKTKLCFWTKENYPNDSIFVRLLNDPQPDTITKFLMSPWAGKSRDTFTHDDFFGMVLGGNAGRIVVRHWLQMPLERAKENVSRWFRELELKNIASASANNFKSQTGNGNNEVSNNQRLPLSIFRLACAAAPLKSIAGRLVDDSEKIPLELVAQLYRAALENLTPSASLLKPIIYQLRSRLVRNNAHYNIILDESRFSLMKLILNRNRKECDMEIKPVLTVDTDDPSYNCGRLLAVLKATQDKAHDYQLEGPGVAERYFGSASTCPASVFPLLLRLNRHHLNKISKSEKRKGQERFLQEQIQNVLCLFGQTEKMRDLRQSPAFPRTLDLQAQGRFAMGFYQQLASDDAARRAASAAKTASTGG